MIGQAGRRAANWPASCSIVPTHWLKTIALRPLRGHLVEVGFQPLELRAGAGGRIEIANLLQSQHQLEDVADRDRSPISASRRTPSFSAS